MSFGALFLEAQVREATGGIPIGVKLSAQHIERDIEAALQVGVDYIILDGRGGATGAAPLILRDNIAVPTIAALALGADAVAVSNAAIQAIGCLGMRACHTNNCPVGIATQKPHLRQRLKIEKGAMNLFEKPGGSATSSSATTRWKIAVGIRYGQTVQ
jgi:glutamate synthase domain-containing protein 2